MNINKDSLLSFGIGNAKLDNRTAHFSLPAGHSCPGALTCLTFSDRETGVIQDGDKAVIRCFSASQEAAFASVRAQRWRNFDLLKAAHTRTNMRDLLHDSMPDSKRWDKMRIHVAGDFFSMAYFQAWVDIAVKMPKHLFYAYTKSGHIVSKFLKAGGVVPSNFVLTGSDGGKFDAAWAEHQIKVAYVVGHPEKTDLKIDHDDSLAQAAAGGDFALLLHGPQKAGSTAAADLRRLKAENIEFSYSRSEPK